MSIFNLLGGIFAARSADRAARRQEYLNSPRGIRKEAEKAGFNPLVFAGSAGSFGSSLGVTGGEILANSLAEAANGLSEADALQIENTRLQKETDRLDGILRENALSASVGGIYDDVRQPNTRPSNQQPVRRPARGAPSVVVTDEDNALTPRPPTEFEPGAFQLPGRNTQIPGGVVIQTNNPGWQVDTDPALTQEHDGPLMRTVTMPDGTVRQYPVGFDLDEMVTGAGIQLHDRVMDGLPSVAEFGARTSQTPFPAVWNFDVPSYVGDAIEARSIDPYRGRPRPRPWSDIREWDMTFGGSWTPYAN